MSRRTTLRFDVALFLNLPLLRNCLLRNFFLRKCLLFTEKTFTERVFNLSLAFVYLEFMKSTDGDLAVFPDVHVVLTGGPNPTFLLPPVFEENFQVVRFPAIHKIAKFETVKRRIGRPWLPRAGHHGYRSFFLGISLEGKVIPWNVGRHDHDHHHYHHH